MASPSWLDAAASFATCATLTAVGGRLVGTGVATMAAGGSGLVPLSLGMLSLLGAGAACTNTEVDAPSNPSQVEGCYKISGGYGWLQIREQTNQQFSDITDINYPQANKATEIVKVEVEGPVGAFWRAVITYKTSDGATRTGYTEKSNIGEATRVTYRIRPVTGSCGDSTEGGTKTYPDNFNDRIEYTNPDTSCVYNIYPQGFVRESDGGGAGFVMKIEAPSDELRTGGGMVGGCNFEPTLVYQPPGGLPPYTAPWDPEWPDWNGGGTPPWLTVLSDLVGGVAANIISSEIAKLWETKYPAGTREIYAACNYKEDGDPETFSVTFPEESYQDRVLTSLNAIVDFQQQILLWKTPTCDGHGTKKGDARTITFISDNKTLAGDRYLVKRFRYRSSSGVGRDDLVNHWKDFTWRSGDVVVSHKGSNLGSPQVWASTADEGKRVIRHAASEAGIDPDQVGRWLIGSSDNARFGLSDTMRVNTRGGYYWITERSGSSARPQVPYA